MIVMATPPPTNLGRESTYARVNSTCGAECAYFEYAFAWQQLLFTVRHDARVIELVSEVFALSIWSCLAAKLNAVLLLVAPENNRDF